MSIINSDIDQAAALLRKNQLVAIPTETVYGLAGNALNESAILEIFRVKNRPKFDPLIAHVDSLDKVLSLVTDIPDRMLELTRQYWPGPLTLLLPKRKHVPDLLTSGLPRIAIRIPNHPLTKALLGQLDFPLAAPSANPFGYVSPTTAQHVNDQLGDKIPFILDGGPCQVGLESTIIGYEEESPVVYRLGGMRIEQLEEVLGPVTIQLNKSSNPSAPGMLKSHYAPGKALIIGQLDQLAKANQNRNIGVIAFKQKLDTFAAQNQIVLSEDGDLEEAASNLFGALRKMDQMDIDLIITEIFPDEGLGKAINDRLHRAAAR